MYSQAVLDHFENPRNAGSLDKEDPDVGIGIFGSVACGDVLQISIRVKDNIIIDCKFKTFGCAAGISSSSLATEMMIGKTIEEAMSIRNTDICEQLELPNIKKHCSVLAQDAIKAAIENYRKKQQKVVKKEEEI